MDGVPYAGDKYLRLHVVVLVPLYRDQVPDEAHPILADVAEAPYERAEVRGAGLGGDKSLDRGEDERHVDWYPHRTEGLGRPQSLGDHRDLDDHVLGEASVALTLGYHTFIVGGDDLGAYRVGVDLLADGLDRLFKVGALLDNERGVGGDSVD